MRIKPYVGFRITLDNGGKNAPVGGTHQRLATLFQGKFQQGTPQPKNYGKENLCCHHTHRSDSLINCFGKPFGCLIALFGSPTNSDASTSSEAVIFITNNSCFIAIIQNQAKNGFSFHTALNSNCRQSEETNHQASYEIGMAIFVE